MMISQQEIVDHAIIFQPQLAFCSLEQVAGGLDMACLLLGYKVSSSLVSGKEEGSICLSQSVWPSRQEFHSILGPG